MAEMPETKGRGKILAGTLVAVLCAWWALPSVERSRYARDFPESPKPLDYKVPGSLRAAYKRDGVVLVRNLVEGEQLEELIAASTAIATRRTLMDRFFARAYSKIVFGLWRQRLPFARLALASALPTIAADLLGEKSSLRVLKDSLFGYSQGGAGCGWHVDDGFFWPAEDGSTGVTFWVSLSNLTVNEGGGLAVAKGSHTGKRAAECRETIRNNTCGMEQNSPSCWQEMEQRRAEWDMQPGDAIVWDRYSFHRAVRFIGVTDETKLRYSVRYIPSMAKPGMYAHEDAREKGSFETPLYPQVWPTTLPDEMATVRDGRYAGADEIALSAIGRLLAFRIKRAVRGLFGLETPFAL